MKRTLTWHLPQIAGSDDSQGPVYYADHDYTAGAIRLYARLAPAAGDLKVDIRADGVSILTSEYASLNKGANLEEHAEDYRADAPPGIAEGSIISFHIINSGDAAGITAHLEIASDVDDEDDDLEDGEESSE